jgi:hypothetical protein
VLLLTEDAKLVCTHELGKVDIEPTQDLVTIENRKVLVDPNPEGREISGCVNVFPLKPCTRTLDVRTGYSKNLVRIQGKWVCLITVTGFTDGAPPGAVRYEVRKAGQDFVSERS